MFDRPQAGRMWFEGVIRDHLDIGRPDQVMLIFDRRLNRSAAGPFRTRVLTEGVDPTLRLSRQSAERILPVIMPAVQPSTVIDVGCGVGTWLAVLAESGVADVWGKDGEYIDRALLQIPQERFLPHDLTMPIDLERRFDLVLCLEVAEHLPADSAPTLVDSLVSLGPVILFSAAIPYQGGTHHVNEQWPEYWARLFAARGYAPVDYVRRQIWQLDDVQWYYAQNILLFVDRGYLNTNSFLRCRIGKRRQSHVCGLSVGGVRSEDFGRPNRRISSSMGRERQRR